MMLFDFKPASPLTALCMPKVVPSPSVPARLLEEGVCITNVSRLFFFFPFVVGVNRPGNTRLHLSVLVLECEVAPVRQIQTVLQPVLETSVLFEDESGVDQ